ncbi:MAG: DUF483 domain-containing protein [Archaeoglobaceae archaeon]
MKISRVLSDSKISPTTLFVVTKDKKFLKMIQRLENRILSGDLTFQRGRKRLIELEGKLFGYPDCCVRAYARSKNDFPLETKLILECFESGTFKILVDSLKNSRIDFFPQFFTMNFYPCSVECKRAKRVGIRLQKFLGDFEKAFKLRTMLNALYLLRVAYKSTFYNGNLSKTAKKFFYFQDRDVLEMIKAISDVDYEEFSNKFIRRVLQSFLLNE